MMDTGNYITIGAVLAGFIANAAFLKGVFGTKIAEHDRDITDLQNKVVFTSTCTANLRGVESRLSRIERIRNGS